MIEKPRTCNKYNRGKYITSAHGTFYIGLFILQGRLTVEADTGLSNDSS